MYACLWLLLASFFCCIWISLDMVSKFESSPAGGSPLTFPVFSLSLSPPPPLHPHCHWAALWTGQCSGIWGPVHEHPCGNRGVELRFVTVSHRCCHVTASLWMTLALMMGGDVLELKNERGRLCACRWSGACQLWCAYACVVWLTLC